MVDSDGNPVNSIWDVEYMHLSYAKKHNVDTIRSKEISKRLSAFSIELGKDNTCRKPGDEANDEQNEHDASKDLQCSDERDVKENMSTLGTKQRGAIFNDDTISVNTEASFTHICIPVPGYDKYGLRKLKKKTFNNTDTRKRCRKGLPALFRHGRKDANERAKEIESETEKQDMDSVQRNSEKREVPKFCAICLDEYEPSDKVCWSSNPECTHVFHHDCMLHWLNSLGKRACKHQRFSEDPSVAQVLNFATECPCCRQSFIDKAVDVEVVDGSDSNV